MWCRNTASRRFPLILHGFGPITSLTPRATQKHIYDTVTLSLTCICLFFALFCLFYLCSLWFHKIRLFVPPFMVG